MRLKRGLTLLEMMIALAMAGFILIALSASLTVAFDWQRRQPEVKERRERITRFQDRLRSLFQDAYLSSDPEDAASFFVGDVSSGAGQYADQVAFSAVGTAPSGAYLSEADDDFETLNSRFGPQAGRVEYSVSMTPVGTSPYESGLYLREQRPADGDPSQGGYESMLNEEVESIQYEFFDGTEWIGTWDTRTESRRLPAAVRITYRLAGEDFDRIYAIRLVHSDVTPENPITQDTGEEAAPQ